MGIRRHETKMQEVRRKLFGKVDRMNTFDWNRWYRHEIMHDDDPPPKAETSAALDADGAGPAHAAPPKVASGRRSEILIDLYLAAVRLVRIVAAVALVGLLLLMARAVVVEWMR